MTFSLTHKQLLTILAILLNVLVIAPAGWTLNYLWNQEIEFKQEVEGQLQQLESDIEQLRIELKTDYLTQRSFNDYREQINRNIMHLDNKLMKIPNVYPGQLNN